MQELLPLWLQSLMEWRYNNGNRVLFQLNGSNVLLSLNDIEPNQKRFFGRKPFTQLQLQQVASTNYCPLINDITSSAQNGRPCLVSLNHFSINCVELPTKQLFYSLCTIKTYPDDCAVRHQRGGINNDNPSNIILKHGDVILIGKIGENIWLKCKYYDYNFNMISMMISKEIPPENQIPVEYLDPKTFEIMKDPVITADGYTYDRSTIEKWFVNHETSPMTNLPLKNRDLIPNHALRSLIQSFNSNFQINSINSIK